jgi:isoleucyl-tRNA synthetase
VHLEKFPRIRDKKFNHHAEHLMAVTRTIASAGLAVRATHGIKVRQPLAQLTLSDTTIRGKKEYLEIIMDEVNVKSIVFNTAQKVPVVLDTNITPELKREGMVREIARAIQELRQTANLSPKDSIRVLYHTADSELLDMMQRAEQIFTRQVNAKKMVASTIPADAVKTVITFEESQIEIAIKKL